MPNGFDEFSAVPVKRAGGQVEVVSLGKAPGALSPEEAADLVIQKTGWKETREELRQRFRQILISHFKDVRDALETRQQLSSPQERGGLGMSPAEVQAVFEAISALQRPRAAPSPPPPSPPSPKPIAPSPKPQAPSPPAPSPAPPIPRLLTPKPQVQVPPKPPQAPLVQEPLATRPPRLTPPARPSIPQAPAPKPQAPPTPPVKPPYRAPPSAPPQPPLPKPQPPKRDQPPPLPATREEAVILLTNEVMRELGLRLPERYIEERLRNAVASRLRDIRDWPETEETLKRPAAIGGVGLREEEAVRVKAALEPRFQRLQTALYQERKEAVVSAIKEEYQTEERRALARKAEERSDLDRLFEEVTGKPAGALPALEAAPLKEPRPLAPPTAPVTPTMPQPPSEVGPPREVQPPARPSMTDVRPAIALVGPVEELRRLTLADFRKLSSNPAEAVRKIQDKLRLLEEESLVKKHEGIAALKESELLRRYFSVMQTALSAGVGIAEAISRQEGAALTEAEFNAIMELNRKLRF